MGGEKREADELARFRHDYALFEELAPPDVPRETFVAWCFSAWEEVQAEAVELRASLAAAMRIIRDPSLVRWGWDERTGNKGYWVGEPGHRKFAGPELGNAITLLAAEAARKEE